MLNMSNSEMAQETGAAALICQISLSLFDRV